MSGQRVAGVVLAAGLGTRLRPLTDLRPKPLCPLGDSTCLQAALDYLIPHCGPGPDNLAVNAFHLADQVVAAVGGQAHVSVEPRLMGTAGALALLAGWRAGRDVLLVNGDAYLARTGHPRAGLLAPLLHGWNRRTVRMLVTETDSGPDFTGPDHRGDEPIAAGWRYVGACLVPGRLLDDLRPEPSGLFQQVWTPARQAGLLELVRHEGLAIDTGTPAGYLAANLHAASLQTANQHATSLHATDGGDAADAQDATDRHDAADAQDATAGHDADQVVDQRNVVSQRNMVGQRNMVDQRNMVGQRNVVDGRNVVGPGAVVEGEITECVVWPGAVVASGERLHRAIRAGTRDSPITVQA